jgi:hypothetical protein
MIDLILFDIERKKSLIHFIIHRNSNSIRSGIASNRNHIALGSFLDLPCVHIREEEDDEMI